MRALSFQPRDVHYPFSQYLRDVLTRSVRGDGHTGIVGEQGPVSARPKTAPEPPPKFKPPSGLSRAERRRLEREVRRVGGVEA
jgi:hypothetical protein